MIQVSLFHAYYSLRDYYFRLLILEEKWKIARTMRELLQRLPYKVFDSTTGYDEKEKKIHDACRHSMLESCQY